MTESSSEVSREEMVKRYRIVLSAAAGVLLYSTLPPLLKLESHPLSLPFIILPISLIAVFVLFIAWYYPISETTGLVILLLGFAVMVISLAPVLLTLRILLGIRERATVMMLGTSCGVVLLFVGIRILLRERR